MPSLASSAARGSAITITSQIIKLVLMVCSTIVLARLISPESYGLVAMVVAVIGVGEIFRDFGLSMAALRATHLTRAQHSNLFWINTAVGAVLTTGFFLLADPIAAFYGQDEIVPIIHVLSLTFVMGGLTTQFRVKINRELRFVSLAATDILPYILAFATALTIALMYGNYWALVAQQLAVSFGTLILSIGLGRWWPGIPRRAAMGGLLKFGLSFAATQLVSYATRNVDSIAVGRVWGAANLGMYDRAYQLLVLPLSQINTPLSRVAIPVLSRIADDKQRFVSYLRQAQLVALYVTASLFLVLAALGEQIVVWLLGAEWQFAGQILSILAFGGIFRSIVQVSYWIYMSRGMAREQFWFYLIAQPLLVIVMLAGLPWGPIGVAVAHSVGYALFWAVSLLWVGRVAHINVRPFFADAARAVLTFGLPAGVLAGILSSLLSAEPAIVRVLVGMGGAVIWFIFAWALFPRVRRDIDVLVRFARLSIKRG